MKNIYCFDCESFILFIYTSNPSIHFQREREKEREREREREREIINYYKKNNIIKIQNCKHKCQIQNLLKLIQKYKINFFFYTILHLQFYRNIFIGIEKENRFFKIDRFRHSV